MLQHSPRFLLTSADWVITITTSSAPATGVMFSLGEYMRTLWRFIAGFFKWTWRLL
ncbi:LOW QUALITY PROTEIN: protease 4 (Protease IV) (Endopeptidase IV) (Signalpeptide peptidase), partial [Escherichia albertii B156]